MQARSAQRGTAQPKAAQSQVIDLTASSSFTLGDRVFHQKFGYGAITGIEGDKLEVSFEKAGVKKVVARFISSAGGETASTGSDDVPF